MWLQRGRRASAGPGRCGTGCEDEWNPLPGRDRGGLDDARDVAALQARRFGLAAGEPGAQLDLLDAGERSGHETADLGLLGVLAEVVLVDVRDVALRVE